MRLVQISLLLQLIAGICAPCVVYAEGTLTVKTVPEGIEVWLDDKYVGESPIVEKKLKAGRYALKIIDPMQHVSTNEEVFVQENQLTLVEKTLKAKFGSLKIATDPEGADVFISTPLGKTPISNDFMVPGKYRLEIRYPGKQYEPATEDITVPMGDIVSLNKPLKEKAILTNKAIARLLLGAGAIGGFVFAIVKQNEYAKYHARVDDLKNYSATQREEAATKASTEGVWRTLGIVGGSLCVIGFEIVAFF